MFSSLASYLFGTNSENPENPSEIQNKPNEQEQQVEGEQQQQQREGLTGDVIEVTARTPSVTGGNRKGGKRGGKNRRGGGGAKQKQAGGVGNAQTRKNSPTITKLLTPSGDNCDEDFDEDEWFIVEKEDEEKSLPRTDSEEDEISIVELQQQQQQQRAGASTASVGGATRRRQHINSHSLYSGPRPQQQRNYLQRSRNAARGPLSISTLSPPRSVPGGLPEQQLQLQQQQLRSADNGITQSLYAAPAISPIGSDQESGASAGSGHGGYGANMSMEESWYVTPPPCFTSIGPINMETSPFENLLIEHPSMSVYHSIRSAQEATDSFVNLDLGVNNEAQQQQQQQQQQQRQLQSQALEQQKPPAPAAERRAPTQSQSTALHERNTNASRIDRQAAAELKQQQLARSSQKSNNKKDHKTLCRGAIKRANQVRDYQSKSNRPRRSDMQHCKLVSGANNNRKCCF